MDIATAESVLIVDDEQDILDLVSEALSVRGFLCRTALNGPEALASLAEFETAFVITDMRMPGMTGLELLDQIVAHHPDCYTLLLTGSADVSVVVQAMRSGACDFITKPFNLAELFQRMDVALEKRNRMLSSRAQVVENEEKLDHIASQFLELTDGVLLSLTAALGAKHPETCAHSERVALRAMQLANAFGLTIDDVRAIYVAGLLHDIGKVGVDRSILEKSTSLEDAEFDQIRAHPVQSAEIAAPVSFSRVTIEAILHHHERVDGTGYPDGMKGDDIPFSARILAVCDAFDAMTSHRNYQAQISSEEGIHRLRQGAGTQWDPIVVEKFCELLIIG